MDNRIKVMLTDVNEDARSMLQDALEETGRFTVVGSTGDGNEVLQMVADAKPDVLVLDLILPGMDGLGILRRMDSEKRPKILAVSNFVTQEVVAEHKITTMMVTHNMHQALELGSRTLMMDSGRIVLDVQGEERKNMTVNDLLERFKARVGEDLDNDRILLS